MRWAELRMCRFWAGGISSFPFSRAREYRLLRRLMKTDAQGINERLMITCGTKKLVHVLYINVVSERLN